MTDRDLQMIEHYVPSLPDPELDVFEYYMRDSADRVIKVRVRDISWDNDGDMVRVERENGNGVFNAAGEVGYGYFLGWYRKWALYDNKEDCRDQTHMLYDHWEGLRELQRKERLI